jgi:predicted ArsR family transcriptional regulator
MKAAQREDLRFLTKDDSRDRIEDDGTGRPRGTYREKDKCIRDFGGRNLNKTSIPRVYGRIIK